jgi:hypothetical protein
VFAKNLMNAEGAEVGEVRGGGKEVEREGREGMILGMGQLGLSAAIVAQVFV